MDNTLLGTFVVAALTVGGSYLTSKQAARATVKTQELSSRTAIEAQAFERAKGYYTDTIDRQEREIHGLEQNVARLEDKVGRQAEQIRRLSTDLRTCKRTLAAVVAETGPQKPGKP